MNSAASWPIRVPERAPELGLVPLAGGRFRDIRGRWSRRPTIARRSPYTQSRWDVSLWSGGIDHELVRKKSHRRGNRCRTLLLGWGDARGCGRLLRLEQLRRGVYAWSWLPWCEEDQHPFNPAWRSGKLIVPYWVLVLIGAAAAYRLLPAGYPRGKCQECGYDLKGVPAEGGVLICPECGAKEP